MSSVPCSKSICLLTISPCASRRDTTRTPLVDQGESILTGQFPEEARCWIGGAPSGESWRRGGCCGPRSIKRLEGSRSRGGRYRLPGASGIHPAGPYAREITRAAWARCCSRLPTHLAHPLEDERAVSVHALGTPLQGSRQNRSEPRRLFPADTPSRGSVVVATRRVCTINAGAPFDHVEIDLQNPPLAEDEFGHRYQCELRTLAEDRAARPEKQVLYKVLRNRGSA